MTTEWTTLPVWGPDMKAQAHMLEPSWFVQAMPEGSVVVDRGQIYHGQSEEEVTEVYRRSSAYWLREKLARSMGKTFDMPVQVKPAVGLYVMDVQMPDGAASEEIEDECETEAEIIEHPLSTKLVRHGPFDNESDAFEWRDVNAPDCLVCFCPPHVGEAE